MENSDNQPPLAEKPLCLAIVLCNEVIEDKRTNSKTLVSIFNNISVVKFPSVHPRLFVMASVTNLKGSMPVHFVIQGPDLHSYPRLTTEIKNANPLDVLDIVYEVRFLTLFAEGVHTVRVLANEEHLAERRFNVTLLRTEPPNG